MDLDDLEPRKQKPKPKNLEELSIEALTDYIAELETEIDRVRQEIAAKERARGTAADVFKR